MKRSFRKHELPESAMRYVLESLLPYTDANLKASFTPNAFFNDLQNIDKQRGHKNKSTPRKRAGYALSTIKKAYYKAKQESYIKIDDSGAPQLTRKGQHVIQPYRPQHLGKDAYLIVAFDIPEEQRQKRRQLRLLLKELRFTQVQQSVWSSPYGHKDILHNEIRILDLKNKVHIYEAVRLK